MARLTEQINLFIADWRMQSRITSDRTEVSYRACLTRHAEVVGNRDLRKVGRDDIKRTLATYTGSPNSRNNAHSILSAFYTWAEQEGLRQTNPARQVPRVKKVPPKIERLDSTESMRMANGCRTHRERRIIHTMLWTGARNQEARGLKGEHFNRQGWVWISSDIAKGGRERWVPVLPEYQPTVEEILANVRWDEYVIPSRQVMNPPENTDWREDGSKPSSPQAIWRTVKEVAERVGIRHKVYPHMLRHAFANMVKEAGLDTAQQLLGHADIGTTMTYLSQLTPDQLQARVGGLRMASDNAEAMPGLWGLPDPSEPVKATTGIEPVNETQERRYRRSDDEQDAKERLDD